MKHALLSLFIVALVSFSAHAATVLHMDLKTLSKEADAIVVVSVEDVQTEVRDGRVFSKATFRTEDVWKGQPMDTFSIRYLGGRHGNLVTRVPGLPMFAEGSREILFLESHPKRKGWAVLGLEQGRFVLNEDRVERSPDAHLHPISEDGKPVEMSEFPSDLKSFMAEVLGANE